MNTKQSVIEGNRTVIAISVVIGAVLIMTILSCIIILIAYKMKRSRLVNILFITIIEFVGFKSSNCLICM